MMFQEKVDIVIVGAGYTGLSAALTLSQAGRSVVVLDAEEIGFGASTRNGGMLGSGHINLNRSSCPSIWFKNCCSDT